MVSKDTSHRNPATRSDSGDAVGDAATRGMLDKELEDAYNKVCKLLRMNLQGVVSQPVPRKRKREKPAAEESAEPKQKRPQSVFFLFSASMRAANPEQALSTKALGEMWKAATEEEKAPFEKEATAAKAEYDATRGGSESEKKNAAKDARPKKARNAYMIYIAHTRQHVNEEFPGIKMTEAAKLMGTR